MVVWAIPIFGGALFSSRVAGNIFGIACILLFSSFGVFAAFVYIAYCPVWVNALFDFHFGSHGRSFDAYFLYGVARSSYRMGSAKRHTADAG